MTTQPAVAAKIPAKVTLEAGKDYWWCTCGLSKNQPYCDGSHKPVGLAPMKYTAQKSGDHWLCQCKQTKNPPMCDGSHKALA